MARGRGSGRPSADPNELFSQFHDVFEQFFGDLRGSVLRGADRSAEIEISLHEAADGAKKALQITRNVRCARCKQAPSADCADCGGTRFVEARESLTITVPAGISDGQILRLQGKGDDAVGDGPPGNLLVRVIVTPHPDLRRRDADLLLDVVIEPEQARLGTSIKVPTLAGKRRISIPAGAATGTEVILKGHGAMRLGAEPIAIPEETGDPYRSRDVSAHRGDQIVIVRILEEDPADPAQVEAERGVAEPPDRSRDPRTRSPDPRRSPAAMDPRGARRLRAWIWALLLAATLVAATLAALSSR